MDGHKLVKDLRPEYNLITRKYHKFNCKQMNCFLNQPTPNRKSKII